MRTEKIFLIIKITLVVIFVLILYQASQHTRRIERSTVITPAPAVAGAASTTYTWSKSAQYLRADVILTPAPAPNYDCVNGDILIRTKLGSIPSLQQMILKRTIRVMIVVGSESHYTFLAASAGIHVHAFDNNDNGAKMRHLARSPKGSWTLNEIYAVGPFIDLMIIQEWQNYFHVLNEIFKASVVKRLIILNTVHGQCPVFDAFIEKYIETRQKYTCAPRRSTYIECNKKNE